MVESGFFYSTVIDPILSHLRKHVELNIHPGENVIDIACGTGAQVFEIAAKAGNVVGVDLSESMITYAKKQAVKRNITNVDFVVSDAANLDCFADKSFDLAIMSLALHQFPPELHSPILNEMKRVSKKIIVVDYAVPLPSNYTGTGSKVAEFLTGREHNRNFKHYCKKGGLNQILPENNLTINKSKLFAKGAFHLVVCSV